jgi:polyisoprenoid-binding protein YceI
MKKIAFLITLLTLTATTFAQWAADKGHSKVAFIANHHGISELDGYFKKYETTRTTNKADLSDAVFEMNIETASINTELEMWDNHLRSEYIFNVGKFPAMTFKNTSFRKIKDNKYVMAGNLTLRGVTKEISLDVTMNGPPGESNKNAKNTQIGIKALGKINRSDFNPGSKLTTAFVSDEIQIRVTGEFNKPN